MANYEYVNGIISAKEQDLLGEKLFALAGGTYENALKTLKERALFSAGETAEETLFFAEEKLNAFVRDTALKPVRDFFLLPYDFLNVKTLLKAKCAGEEIEGKLAPWGTVKTDELSRFIEKGKGEIDERLISLIGSAKPLFEKGVSGREIGRFFAKAEVETLKKACKRSRLLTRFLKEKIDGKNLLFAVRAKDKDEFFAEFLPCGTLKKEEFLPVFDPEKREKAFDGRAQKEFYSTALKSKVCSERDVEDFALKTLYAKRFELSGGQPLIYYILRVKCEIVNARILLSGTSAGMAEDEIKRRMRGSEK